MFAPVLVSRTAGVHTRLSTSHRVSTAWSTAVIQMPDWKDQYREEKNQSGKTWDEFVADELYHESELDDLRSEVDRLNNQLTILSEEIQSLRRNIGEVIILARGEADE